MDIEFHEMKEDWTAEHSSHGQLVYISRPQEIGGGFVTIDFARRTFAGGYGPPWAGIQTAEYKGRGWQERIVRDAVDWLEATMTQKSNEAASSANN